MERPPSREERFLAALRSEWDRFGEIKDKALLVELGLQSEKLFNQVLDEHAAKPLADKLKSVDYAFSILDRSRRALIDLAGRFHYRVVHDAIHETDGEADLGEATGEVFQYANAAESLVQAYRHLVSGNADFAARYETVKSEVVGDAPIVRFVKDLRNHNNHINILQATPHYTIEQDFSHGTTKVKSGLRFNKTIILHGPKWSPESKALARDTNLDVTELLTEHFKIASQFYRKAPSRVGVTSDPQLRDFERLAVVRRTMSYRNALAILLQIAIPKNLDPYEHLSSWFTSEEIERIRALPDHSKEQVDYLISLRDPLGLCDTHTRQQLYAFFSAPTEMQDVRD